MIFNILPTNRTFLELLVVGKNTNKIALLRHFFKILNKKNFEDVLLIQPQLSLIRNLEGKTGLDWALQMEPVRNVSKERAEVNCFDPILAEEILRGIVGYDIYTIKDVSTAIPRAVEYGVPYLPEFLDMRMKKYNLYTTKPWTKNYFIKDSHSLLFTQYIEETKTVDETFVTSNCFAAWHCKRKVAEVLFLPPEDVSAYSEIDFRVMDIPNLHNIDSSISEDFIAQLRNVNNSKLFEKYSISAIIQQRFKRAQKFFVYF